MCGHRHRQHHHGRHHADPARPRRAQQPEERIGDAEREATLERLAEHFAAGRLTEAELDERSTAASEARTRGDLAALEADLPPVGDDPRLGRRARRPRAAPRERVLAAAGCHAWWAVPVGLVIIF